MKELFSKMVTRRRYFALGKMSVVKGEELERLRTEAVRAEVDALAKLGTIVAGAGETLRLEMFQPMFMPVFGGLVETLIPGTYCTGDEQLSNMLDGELKLTSRLEPEEFRLVSVTVRTDGLDLAYGRPYFCGRALNDGRMIVHRRHLRFVPMREEREFVIELLDTTGDASRLVSVRLNDAVIIVDDGISSVSCPRTAEASSDAPALKRVGAGA